MDHPNIIKLIEVYNSTDDIYIVEELCEGPDLIAKAFNE